MSQIPFSFPCSSGFHLWNKIEQFPSSEISYFHFVVLNFFHFGLEWYQTLRLSCPFADLWHARKKRYRAGIGLQVTGELGPIPSRTKINQWILWICFSQPIKNKTFIDLEITRKSAKPANHLKIAHHPVLIRCPCILFLRWLKDKRVWRHRC